MQGTFKPAGKQHQWLGSAPHSPAIPLLPEESRAASSTQSKRHNYVSSTEEGTSFGSFFLVVPEDFRDFADRMLNDLQIDFGKVGGIADGRKVLPRLVELFPGSRPGARKPLRADRQGARLGFAQQLDHCRKVLFAVARFDGAVENLQDPLRRRQVQCLLGSRFVRQLQLVPHVL